MSSTFQKKNDIGRLAPRDLKVNDTVCLKFCEKIQHKHRQTLVKNYQCVAKIIKYASAVKAIHSILFP